MNKHEEKPDVYYVGFTDSISLRRVVLETAKASVEVMHSHSRIREIQEQKLKLRSELAHILKDMKDSLQKLRTFLPDRDVPMPIAPAKKKVVERNHRLDKIESALSEIEHRLQTL